MSKNDTPRAHAALARDLSDAHVAPAVGATDPHWYKDAVIYELHVKSFFDSNDDGIGDLRGLTAKLDYIAELGVNTVWLLPFYPSPFRDDGYDVADYHNVHPAYGTRTDFRQFVREAHRRGLRVITELVVNHTSDAHPWFQAARRAPKGSSKRNYYVWSDDPTRYAGTRIIFTDTEKSNWTWDPVAQQYFWHRFFSHQPDLNFDHPGVKKAVLRAMRFWLDMGVDGLRLDAIPYLIERDGTSNENLPETHALIRQWRAALDERHAGRMLLAEANMWPEDVREYFGDGDACHMAFHFPLMPRMYMAIAQEDRFPITDILRQTPEIPASCQWAIFLRNHDELTLEMVTSRERDAMWKFYASDPRAKLNLGIRRRLAPLMENDRRRIELMNCLLLTMPGTPVIYYGDEIGMGDNLFLGDRDGVRTPMQWRSERNGGFSRAEPQSLVLPAIQDPMYGFEAVNVEAQQRAPGSLLLWMRRMLAVRAGTRVFGRGTFSLLAPGNRKVLAYLRQLGNGSTEETVLCVANLSRTAQPVELDLTRFKGRVPVELTGRTPFPPVTEAPYLLTLPPYGFLWLQLASDVAPPDWHVDRTPRDDAPVLVLFDGLASLFRERVVPWRIALADRTRAAFEREVLPPYLARQPWLKADGSAAHVVLVDHLEPAGEAGLLLAWVRPAAGTTTHVLPLSLAWEETDEARHRDLLPHALAKVRQQAQLGVLADGSADARWVRWLQSQFAALAQGRSSTLTTASGRLHLVRTTAAWPLPGEQVSVEHTSRLTRVTWGALTWRVIRQPLYFERRGPDAEIEVLRHLTDVAPCADVAPLAGWVEHETATGARATVLLIEHARTVESSLWRDAVDSAQRVLESPTAAVDGDAFAATLAFLGERLALLQAQLARGGAAFQTRALTRSDVESIGIKTGAANHPLGPAQRVAGVLRLQDIQRSHDSNGQLRLTFTELGSDRVASPWHDIAALRLSLRLAWHTAPQSATARVTDGAEVGRAWLQRAHDALLGGYERTAVEVGVFADQSQAAAARALLPHYEAWLARRAASDPLADAATRGLLDDTIAPGVSPEEDRNANRLG